MKPLKFSNFQIAVMAYAAISITGKITSLFKTRMTMRPVPEINISPSATGLLKNRITAAISDVVVDAIDEHFWNTIGELAPAEDTSVEDTSPGVEFTTDTTIGEVIDTVKDMFPEPEGLDDRPEDVDNPDNLDQPV